MRRPPSQTVWKLQGKKVTGVILLPGGAIKVNPLHISFRAMGQIRRLKYRSELTLHLNPRTDRGGVVTTPPGFFKRHYFPPDFFETLPYTSRLHIYTFFNAKISEKFCSLTNLYAKK